MNEKDLSFLSHIISISLSPNCVSNIIFLFIVSKKPSPEIITLAPPSKGTFLG